MSSLTRRLARLHRRLPVVPLGWLRRGRTEVRSTINRRLREIARATMVMLIVAWAAIAATPAGAVPTCAHAGGVVTVSLPAAGDEARVVVGTGAQDNHILFAMGDAAASPCGTATVQNTDSVDVSGGAGAQSFRLSLAGGPFGPGATAEPTGASEIEFDVDLGGDEDDELVVAGDGVADSLVIGTDGINLNAGEDPDDVDVVVSGVADLALEGAAGNDAVSGNGGEGTGSPYAGGGLSLRGGDDADTLTGSPGDDVLSGGEGADQLDGGGGIDTVSYFSAPSAVTVDLGAGSAGGGDGVDALTALENITGSAFDDVLSGDAGDNRINGLGGNDTINGRQGVDAAGFLLAPSAVTVDLAAGTTSGGDGVDSLVGVENVLGSDFDDVLRGDASANFLLGGPGADDMRAFGGNDSLNGGPGPDDLRGGDGADGLRGGGGEDDLWGGQGNDSLRGGPSVDACKGGPGFDQIDSCEE
jgi:Ca2+-binding RTX toxin-like protein